MERPTPSLGVWLIWIYTFWIFATPYNATHLSFLGDLRFERILAGVLILYSLSQLGTRWRDARPMMLFGAFFAICLISAVSSPLADSERAVAWLGEYWKIALLYFFILFSLRTKEDVYLVLLGISALLLGYQLLSWRDFLAGGSYVYQQGTKRMVGVWSGGGLGAANGFAITALFVLPFYHLWGFRHRSAWSIGVKVLGIVVSIASIVFSGTRGAMLVGLMVLGGGVLVFSRKRFKLIALALVVAVVAYAMLPEDLHRRYSEQLLPSGNDSTASSTSAEVASKSAEGRIEGLQDGYALFLQRPLFGWGPGTSATARMQLPNPHVFGKELQLHSLFGQIIAEIGLLGTLVFGRLVWILIRDLYGVYREATVLPRTLAGLLLTTFAIYLLYGFVTHSLFGHEWILLFGLSTVLISEWKLESILDETEIEAAAQATDNPAVETREAQPSNSAE